MQLRSLSSRPYQRRPVPVPSPPGKSLTASSTPAWRSATAASVTPRRPEVTSSPASTSNSPPSKTASPSRSPSPVVVNAPRHRPD